MKRTNLLLLFLIAVLALSACQTASRKDAAPSNTRKHDVYSVDKIESLNQWVISGDKNVLPNTPDRTITEDDLKLYGDVSHLIDKIQTSGYLLIRSTDGEPLNISICNIYDKNQMHDIFLRFEYALNDNIIVFPCFITYISEVDMNLAQTSPVEYIETIRGITLYSVDEPQIIGNDKRVIQPQMITIGDTEVQSVTIEYVDCDRAGKEGVIFFIYNNMLVQLQAPYSREGMPYALENIILDTYYIDAG